MVISYCVPCSRRVGNLVQSLPAIVVAANVSPPVEIMVLDYANESPLDPVLDEARGWLVAGNTLVVPCYRGRPYYHMAHARNLAAKLSTGEYLIQVNTDTRPTAGYFEMIRARLEETGAVWMEPHRRLKGIIVIRRDEFLAAGGYDERFEFYGSEDAELRKRLWRRGSARSKYPDGYLEETYTPDEVKVLNYRLPLSKREMHRLGMLVYDENNERGLLVANEGLDWGAA
jgi:hypothetical protein